MPAYNRADLIGKSIESALGQTFTGFELLVVDDGSADGTREVVRGYDDARVRLLEGQHRGMSATMNMGVRAARGEYYARLDSDDLWDPKFLERTVPVLERQSSVGVVYPRARTFSDTRGVGQATRGRPLTVPGNSFASMIVGDCASGAALVRVECHRKVGGYDETMLAWEDWDYWVRVSRHYDFHFVDEVLASLRVHARAFVDSAGADVWRSRVRVLDKVFESAEPVPAEVARVKELAYRNVYLDVGCAYWQRGDVASALSWFRKGVHISGRPLRAGARAAYLVCLQRLGKLPYFWDGHAALSRALHRARTSAP